MAELDRGGGPRSAERGGPANGGEELVGREVVLGRAVTTPPMIRQLFEGLECGWKAGLMVTWLVGMIRLVGRLRVGAGALA